MKVPKRSLMAFWMFSVQSQLQWSFISRHKMFKATSATAVSAVDTNTRWINHVNTATYKTFDINGSDATTQLGQVWPHDGVLAQPSGETKSLQVTAALQYR